MSDDATNEGQPASEPMPDTLELVLRKPVTYAKTEHTVLKLSEPTAGQLIKASKAGNELEQGAALIHLNAAVPMAVVEQLSQRDFEEAAGFFARFSSLVESAHLGLRVARLARFYGWTPNDALALTVSEIAEWEEYAEQLARSE